MGTANVTAEHKEVAVEARPVEIDVSSEGRACTVVGPTVSAIKRLQGDAVESWSTTFRRIGFSDPDVESVRDEFQALHKHYEEFRTSGVFLHRLASMAAIIGDHEAAERFYEEAVAASDVQELAYRRADYRLTEERDFVGAIDALEELEKAGYLRAGLRLAEHELAHRQVARASTRVFAILHREPDDWRANLVGGTLALLSGSYPIAIRLYRTASIGCPNSRALVLNLAIAHYLQGNIAQALKKARHAAGLDPWDERAPVFFADVVLAEQNRLPRRERSDAFNSLVRYLEANRHSSALASRVAQLALDTGEPTQGARALEESIKDTPTAESLNNLAVLLWASQNKRVALARLFAAADLSMRQPSGETSHLVYANLVHLLNEIGQADRAEEFALDILKEFDSAEASKDRALSQLYLGYILSLAYQEKYDAAVAQATSLVTRTDLYPMFKVNLATALTCYYSIVVGDFERSTQYARIAYEHFAEIDRPAKDMEATVANNLAYSLIETGNLAAARPILEWLDRVPSRIPLQSATRGLYHIRMGKLEKGEKEYRVAIALTSDESQRNLLRKKLNLELAKALRDSDPARAARLVKSGMKLKSAGRPWSGTAVETELEQLNRVMH